LEGSDSIAFSSRSDVEMFEGSGTMVKDLSPLRMTHSVVWDSEKDQILEDDRLSLKKSWD